MIIKKPWLCSQLDIWSPKYHTDSSEWEAWLSKAKVYHASPIILVRFTKAKHLIGQRFAITRTEAQKCREVNNGRIACLAIPMSKLEHWESAEEIVDNANKLFEE